MGDQSQVFLPEAFKLRLARQLVKVRLLKHTFCGVPVHFSTASPVYQ
jgi:hypothetical protein